MARAMSVAALAAILVVACGTSSSKGDDPLPNAGVIPAALPASGPVFHDHLDRYTIAAPEAWQSAMMGNPPNLMMTNPDDRSVQIAVDFGAGLDLEAAKERAQQGIQRATISFTPEGDGQWWRREGIEGWGLWLAGTSSGQPIDGYAVWLVGPPGALAIVGAGPPQKKNAVRALVESVANSVTFQGHSPSPR